MNSLFERFSRPITIFCFCLVAFVIAQASPPESRVLIGLAHNTREEAEKAAIDIGAVTGIDKQSGMFILRLKDSMGVDKAIASLKKEKGIRFAMPFSAKTVDKRSYRSVDWHVRYLDAADELRDDDKNARPKPHEPVVTHDSGDFYNAFRWYLQRRVAIGTDVVDFQALKNAKKHVAQMPTGRIGGFGPSGFMGPAVITGGSWSYLGPNNLTVPYQLFFGIPPISGRISCVAYDPTNADVIYAGSGGGGLWKSANGGLSWTCVSDTATWIYGAVDAIAIDPKNHNTLYVGTGDFDGFFDGYNQGILKSTDGGATWTNLATNVPGIYDLAVSHIVIDPTNDQIITCTTGRGGYGGPNEGEGGIWRSTDGGTTWAKASVTATDYCALDISIPNSDGNVTYWALGSATTQSGPGLMYNSTNHGATWNPVAPPDQSTETQWTLACSKVSATTLYVLATAGYDSNTATGSGVIYKTTNSGATWSNVTNNMPGPANNEDNWSQGTYDYFLGTYKAPQASDGEVVFCGLITLCYSTNGGTTWVDYGNTYQSNANEPAIMHNDQHVFAVSPTDGTQVLVGNDGGLFRLGFSWDVGTPRVSLTSLNANLGISQIYELGPHPTNPNYLLSGTQDNSSPSAFGGYTNWTNFNAGDGGFCGWDIPYGLFYTTADGGNVFLYNLQGDFISQPGLGYNDAGFVAPTAITADGKTMYLGASGMMSADMTSDTPTFSAEGPALNSGNGNYITFIGLAPSDVSRIYTGATDGEVWMSANASSTWTEIDGGVMPPGVVAAVNVNPLNENDVLVGFANTGIPHLYRTTNANAATPTWTSVGGSSTNGLPDEPLDAIVRDPYNPTLVWYVATDVGVFMTQNGGGSWTNVTSNLPPTQVFDLRYANGYLYAGTFGRGAWRIAVAPPLAGLTLNASTVTAGGSVTGTVSLPAPAAGTTVTVALSSSNAAATTPASVSVASGTQSATFTVTSHPVSATTTVTISANSGGVTKTAELNVKPGDPVSGLTLSSGFVEGGHAVTATVSLTSSPGGDVDVALSSNDAAAKVQTPLLFTPGVTTRQLSVSTSTVSTSTSVTISATEGGATKTATLIVNPPCPLASISADSSSVSAGAVAKFAVGLLRAAPYGGIVVSLTSNSACVVPPASVTFAAGVESQAVSVPTYSVSSAQTVTLTASAEGVSKSATLMVKPVSFNLTLSPVSVMGGKNSDGVVRLSSSPGSTVTASISCASSLVGVPASVTFAKGVTAASFPITTKGVAVDTPVVVTVTINGLALPAVLTLTPPPISTFTLSPASVVGGKPSDGIVRLVADAVSPGDVVSISCSSAEVVVPSSVTVPAGTYAVSFPITTKTVTTTTQVTITVSFAGSSVSEVLTLTP